MYKSWLTMYIVHWKESSVASDKMDLRQGNSHARYKAKKPSLSGMDAATFEKHVGGANTSIIRRHLAFPLTDHDLIPLDSVSGAREKFSAAYAGNGIRIVAPRGAEPMAVLTLKELGAILDEVQAQPTLTSLLAPSEDLPAASPITMRRGSVGKRIKL